MEELQPGWIQTRGASCTSRNLVDCDTDFLNFELGKIIAYKFEDVLGDGHFGFA